MGKDKIDVVIPIPDTSRTSAMSLAHELDVRFTEGFIKNRYIGRTFIMPGQTARKKSVRQKLNPIDVEFKGKERVAGGRLDRAWTTSRQIVRWRVTPVRAKVYFASAAPPVRYPTSTASICRQPPNSSHMGVPMKRCAWIGADGLIYQDLQDLIDAVGKKGKRPRVQRFDTSVLAICHRGYYARVPRTTGGEPQRRCQGIA